MPVGPSGIEELNAALRRSIWLIVALAVLGVAFMNVFEQLGGPEYQSTSRVLLSTTDLAGNLSGIQPVYVDPQRKDAAEQNLANSPQLFTFAAKRVGGSLGTGAAFQSATTASAANNVVGFLVTASDSLRATNIANAVADAYPKWRAAVSGRAIDLALAQLRAQIGRSGKTTTLQDQLQRLLVLKTLNSGDSLFVEHADSATKITPRPVRDSLLGGVIGLVAALLIVGAMELFNTSVRSESDVEDILGTPVLATIHSLPRRLRSRAVGGGDPQHADEYELLAANIAQTFEVQTETVCLAITSAIPGEGKTTTAANLAAALARRGASVLLADFDLRKPSVDKFFAIPRDTPGIHEVLSGRASINSILWAVPSNGDGARPTPAGSASLPGWTSSTSATKRPHGALAVLPGGRVVSGRTAPGFTRLASLLSDLPQNFHFVIIDTPPALLVAGMAELAQVVDAALIVVRHSAVSTRQLRSLARQARSWRAPVLGAVFNDAKAEDLYGYGGYHGST